ncbi:recombinase family protein [Agrobacterium leguminum]|uniref:recombinase family protein n=1 Tax=Agrobacterium leguminum TaxID=2792015 RepID=UPI0022B84EF2|nr:recombinase family protein [Agrobacterium leguminum]MCZ7932344.1 recombinase family protein [Agrobacterium leguminum]
MRVAYSYMRFSTPDQIDGDSLRRQSSKTTNWCERKGVHLDTTLSFEDLGRSAFTGSHFNEGALGVFFALVNDGTIKPGSYLVIESLDRFSRENPMIAAGRLFELVKAGITVVTVDDDREYSPESLGGTDNTAMLILVIKLSQSHAESVRKSQLIGPAWEKKKALARTDRTPLTSRGPQWLTLRDGVFDEREDRVRIVRRIFRETIEGFGRREIVRRLNADKIDPFRADEKKRTKRSTGWHTSSVAKIIQNRMVLGEYQPHVGSHRNKNRRPDGEPIKDYYPRIIDDETFWRAQNATEGRRQSAGGRKGQKGAHILQGLARCTSCDGPMHIQNKGALPKGGIWLACSSNIRKAGCDNNRRIRVDRLERDLLTALLHVDVAALASLDDETPQMLRQIEALKAKLADAKVRRTRLLSVLVTEDEEVQEQFVQVAAEVKELTKRLKEQEKAAASRQADPGTIARLATANELSGQLEEADLEKRRELRIKLTSLLRGLVERVECRPIGPVMILKPRLEVRMTAEPMPFAFRMDYGVVSMLLESPANNDALNQFFLGLGGASGME